jgi:DNA-directed RNA polymerase subunit M/transcription elongation factor TFIIS|uniref:TFIIS-type domain-containing protein n=1 Tax=viral metagenome TaxID=1070528 RepID=A0A6C0IRE7_9ZZZZ
MKTVSNPNKFRANLKEKLNIVVEDENITSNVETSIFNYALDESDRRKLIKKWDNPRFVEIYLNRFRSIYINLKNTAFLEQIKNKEITGKTLERLTHYEMDPERWSELIDKKIKREASKFNTNIQASTDMFTCRKCKSKKCTYYELQTRSADEPATIFVTCLDCGKNWRS